MNEYIELKNVSKKYSTGEKEFYALKNFDLKIKRGELVVVLGPSGAGKSTFLNVLGGMDRVSSGKILVYGKDITKLSEDELTKYRASDIGFVFQFYNIMPTLTVKENVELVKDVTKTKKNVNDVLSGVKLSRHANKFPSELSGGEQQRVAIARAIMKDPKILLCDEPTGALDSHTGVEILKLLKSESDNNTTVIIVTHNSLISEIADTIINIKNGEVESVIKNKHPKNIDEVNW